MCGSLFRDINIITHNLFHSSCFAEGYEDEIDGSSNKKQANSNSNRDWIIVDTEYDQDPHNYVNKCNQYDVCLQEK